MMGMRRRRARVTYGVSASVLAILAAIVLATGCTNEREQLAAREAGVVRLLVQHDQLREFLENTLYALSDNVFITRDPYVASQNDGAVLFSDGHLTIPGGHTLEWHEAVKKHEPQIIAIFETFECENISLVQANESGQKELDVWFGQIIIGDDYFAEWLSYSRDGATGAFVDEPIFPGWHYSAPQYT
jgi:hypothetical protein